MPAAPLPSRAGRLLVLAALAAATAPDPVAAQLRSAGTALRLGATLRRSWERYDSDALATYDFLTGGYVDAGGNPVTGPEGYVNDDPALFGKRDERQGALWAEFASLDGRLTHRLDYQDSVFKQNNEGGGWTTGKTRKLKITKIDVGL